MGQYSRRELEEAFAKYNEARIEGGGLYVGRGTLDGVRCGPASDANVRYNDPQDCVFE